MTTAALRAARAGLVSWRDSGHMFNRHPAWVVVEAQPSFASLCDALRLLARPGFPSSVSVLVAVPRDDSANDGAFFARLDPPPALADQLTPVLAGALRQRYLHDLRHRHLRNALMENLLVLAIVAALVFTFRHLGGGATIFASPLLLLILTFDLILFRDALRGVYPQIRIDLNLSAQEVLDGFFAAEALTPAVDVRVDSATRPRPDDSDATAQGTR